MVIPPIYRIMGTLGLTNSLTGLVVIYTAFNVPFATFLMETFFQGVPRELEEAAVIDGGTPPARSAASCCRWRCRGWGQRSASCSPPRGASCCSH